MYPRWVLTEVTRGVTDFKNIVILSLSLIYEGESKLFIRNSELLQNQGRSFDETDNDPEHKTTSNNRLIGFSLLIIRVNLGRSGATESDHSDLSYFLKRKLIMDLKN